MLINCWILDHVCSFSRWFKYVYIKCEHVRFLEDFVARPKCPETETAKTETAKTESARPKRPDQIYQTVAARPKRRIPPADSWELIKWCQVSQQW